MGKNDLKKLWLDSKPVFGNEIAGNRRNRWRAKVERDFVSTHILEDKRKICNRIPLGFPFSSNNNQDIIEKETYNESISKGKKH